MIFDLRSDLYSHIQQLPLTWFDNRSTGDIMTRNPRTVSPDATLEQAIEFYHPQDRDAVRFAFQRCIEQEWGVSTMDQ